MHIFVDVQNVHGGDIGLEVKNACSNSVTVLKISRCADEKNIYCIFAITFYIFADALGGCIDALTHPHMHTYAESA